MYKINRICTFGLLCLGWIMLLLFPVRVQADERDGDRYYLSEPGNVSDGDILRWAEEAGLETDMARLYDICTMNDIAESLWALNGRPDTHDTGGNALEWAIQGGLLEDGEMVDGSKEMRHVDALGVLWASLGKPALNDSVYPLTMDENDPNVYQCAWAVDERILLSDEAQGLDYYGYCTNMEWLRYLCYHYIKRNTFPITRSQLVQQVASVAEWARVNGLRYGNSQSVVPCDDGYISCDRLIARALYELGYTDQPAGGICGYGMADYLRAHGFVEGGIGDIGYGSIVEVVSAYSDTNWHTFLTTEFDAGSMTMTSYDCGSNSRIQSVQPFIGQGWIWGNFIRCWNIPG